MPADIVVLIVEDDLALQRSLQMTLKAAGYHALGVTSIDEAKRAINHHRPSLILLDLGLPDGDGLSLITEVRKNGMTPVVVLTARDAEAVKVRALDAGADDYVTKPFGLDELLARLRAALRHGVQASGSDPVVRTGALEIDLAAHVVRRAGAEVDLSPKEFDLIAALALQLGKVVRHKDLLATVWGSGRADIQYLRVYVGQLRAKLEEDPAHPRLLVSDPGVGYRLLDA